MKLEKSFKKNLVLKIVLLSTLIMAFFSPILIYTFNFGFHLTSDHQRWAEFGTFISGIYAPVLSLVTLLILASQYRLQNRMNIYQIEQATINRLVNNNSQYLEEIFRSIESTPFRRGQTVETILANSFYFLSFDDLSEGELSKSAMALYSKVPKISDCWMALNSNLRTLESIEGTNYKAAFSSEILRIQSTLSHGTCASLDNFMRCLKGTPTDLRVYFSEI